MLHRPMTRRAADVSRLLFVLALTGGAAVIATGCLDRPVAPQQPNTARLTTKMLRTKRVDKIDLLFMIDSSASMADKQQILSEAVSDLLQRLTRPDCVARDSGQRIVGSTVDACPTGFVREFDPVEDIHIGVVSSSLAYPDSHNCKSNGDRGLLTRTGGQVGAGDEIDGERFLTWDPSAPQRVIDQFASIVRGVGEGGCGYESNLESWYRFLVDPAPPKSWKFVPCFEGDTGNGCRVVDEIDQDVLAQRSKFLRPDSLLAVIMLTDENDCSIDLHGQGWLASREVEIGALSRGTNACLEDPDSPDCMPCNAIGIDLDAFPECYEAPVEPYADYDSNLRCWEQKRRFGHDFLYPLARYVRGLQEPIIDGHLNPVFCSEANPSDPTGLTCKHTPRSADFVFLGGITGVPWQDIARDPRDLRSGYLPTQQLAWTQADFESEGITPPAGVEEQTTLWDVILGGVSEGNHLNPTQPARDPLMIESVRPRDGVNPALGVPLVPPEGAATMANAINGHEWNAQPDGQLQYACVFDLPAPIDCLSAQNCDCTGLPDRNNPLCQDASGAYGTTQYRAKAFPGLRQLGVVQGMGEQGIVASICPATLDTARADYGYRPAVGAIVDRLASVLAGTCWDEPLDMSSEGQVACVVLEATRGVEDGAGATTCPPCEGVRKPASALAWTAVGDTSEFRAAGMACLCEIQQAPADNGAMRACVEQSDPGPDVAGWCYLDENANPELLGRCNRMIRFVGEGEPVSDALTFVQCRGASI